MYTIIRVNALYVLKPGRWTMDDGQLTYIAKIIIQAAFEYKNLKKFIFIFYLAHLVRLFFKWKLSANQAFLLQYLNNVLQVETEKEVSQWLSQFP